MYTLESLYAIFQDAQTKEAKIKLLKEWSASRFPYDINWGALIRAWLRK